MPAVPRETPGTPCFAHPVLEKTKPPLGKGLCPQQAVSDGMETDLPDKEKLLTPR